MLIKAAAFVLIAALGGCTGPADGAGIGVASGFEIHIVPEAERAPAPAFEGELLAGEPVSSETLLGSPAVINFWGSWCGPCRKEQPLLQEAWERLESKAGFVGINTRGDQRAAALAFLDEFSVTYPSIYDPTSAIADAFGVRTMPATFLLDSRGRVAAEIVGAIRTADELIEVLDKELAG